MAKDSKSTKSFDVTFLRARDYRVIKELGSGACGRTVLLHDDQIDEQFVCKKYSPFSEDVRQELFEGFVREIKLLHSLQHPNVVRIFSYFLYPDQYVGYILMEHIDGADIADHIKSHPEHAGSLFLQAIEGFAHLEERGVLHRDIRPQNILVRNDGQLKIIDLGFGKQVDHADDFAKSISLNWWCEKPHDFEEGRYDFSTEVYFVGKLFEQMLLDNELSEFPYASTLRRMCEKEPANRYQCFSALLQDVRANKFSEADFSWEEQKYYREFSDAVISHITKMRADVTYNDDPDRIEQALSDAYRKCMLEVTVPDSALILRIFADGTYYYRKAGFRVDVVNSFLKMFRSCSTEKKLIILANLHGRLDSIARYHSEPEDDIPF